MKNSGEFVPCHQIEISALIACDRSRFIYQLSTINEEGGHGGTAPTNRSIASELPMLALQLSIDRLSTINYQLSTINSQSISPSSLARNSV
ncbi:MAG: hypothetical protein ACRC62_01030 [Microcoleus sp.]